MIIFVKLVNNTHFVTLENVSADDTILEIKGKIKDKYYKESNSVLNEKNQVLIFSSKLLSDNMKISDYNIGHECAIYLVVNYG